MMLKSIAKRTPVFNFTLFILASITISSVIDRKGNKSFITGSILKGFFAEPTTIKDRDKFYINAAIDPCGSNKLTVFETKDFLIFSIKHLNYKKIVPGGIKAFEIP